jgi:hypothetical protein
VPIGEALEQLGRGEAVPRCAQCRGWLKPATVSITDCAGSAHGTLLVMQGKR